MDSPDPVAANRQESAPTTNKTHDGRVVCSRCGCVAVLASAADQLLPIFTQMRGEVGSAVNVY